MPDSLPSWANSRIAARPPPSPRLELRTGDALFLLLPASADTATLTRFDTMRGTDRLGRIDFAHLLDTLRHDPHAAHDNIAAIRRFYAAWRHADPTAPTPHLIRRLRDDVATNRLAVFRLRQNPHHAILRTTPHTRPPAPDTQIATWSPERKVVVMLEAIPDHLAGAARAEFRAFLTPQNLAVTAASLAGLAALQAVPGADAAMDSLIAGLAWWQFGWSGLLAARDFVDAVIKSGRATTREEIALAAKLAAAALVSLGLTLLLRDLAKRVHEAKPGTAAEEKSGPTSRAPPNAGTRAATPASAADSRSVTAPRDAGTTSRSESTAAYRRATAARGNLPSDKEFRAKTVASDGEKTLSGWKQPRPDGFAGATPQEVQAQAREIGHTLPAHPYDRDFPGQYFASHAEKQLSLISPDHPIGVSKPMCDDCQAYFSRLAQSRGIDQTVTDPDGTWLFRADGTVGSPK